MPSIFRSVILLLVSLLWLSCEKQQGHKAILDIKNNEWFINKSQNFTFEVTDPNQVYHIHFLIRNASSYPYYNLYFQYKLTDPQGKVLRTQLEEVILFDPKTGKPLGKGLGDIFDHAFKSSSLKNIKFPAKGSYKISVMQYMRQDPLKGILSVGVHVEPKSNTPATR